MVLVAAGDLKLRGEESQREVNGDRELLHRCEAVRACGAVRMGLAASAAEATAKRPATPKLALVSGPAGYVASSGKAISAADLDLNVRVLSMGQLHHALPGTAAVAIAVAAKIPGTMVHRVLADRVGVEVVRLGHPSGCLTVSAEAELREGHWSVTKVVMSRSARRLMEGLVLAPPDR
jgi:2-methylaconitate cis-trans-isomerase PrpF